MADNGTKKVTVSSVLLPVFQVLKPSSRLADPKVLESELKFLFPDGKFPLEEISADSWLSAKPDHQTRTALEAEGIMGDDLNDLGSKQLSLYLLVRAMNESLELASAQSRASLATLFMGYYSALCCRGLAEAQVCHPTAPQVLKRWGPLAECLKQVDRLSIGIFPVIDFITATLSVNPSTGELEREGLVKPLPPQSSQEDQDANKKAISMGARAALLRKLLETRASRSDAEFEVLKWMHGDPMLGRSLFDWMLVTATLVEGDEDHIRLKWEGSNCSNLTDAEHEGDTVLRDALSHHMVEWAHSLALLSMTLAVYWISKSTQLITSAGVNMDVNGILGNPSLIYQPDLPFITRLTNFSVTLMMDSKLLWLGHEYENGDTFHLRLLDADPDLSKSQRMSGECGLCMQMKKDSLLVLEPCVHQCCEDCMRRHLGGSKKDNTSPAVSCPFCRRPVQNAARLKQETYLERYDALSGSIGTHSTPISSRLSEVLAAACKATNRAERPPLSLLMVKVSIEEPDGTVGSALSFLSDGLNLAKVYRENIPFGASLNDRVTPNGQHQCQSYLCMKMETVGGPKFNRCANCHHVYYCSKDCQKHAWTKGSHKRICKAYKEHLEVRTGLSAAAAELQKKQQQSDK